MCMLYLYHYGDKQLEEEPLSQPPVQQPQPPPATMDVDTQGVRRADKRSGTDTRTVTFGPEAKKQKYAYVDTGDRVREVFLSMHQRRWETQLPIDEPSEDEASPCTTTTDPPRQETTSYKTEHVPTITNLFTMHGANADKYHADIRKGGIFRVDASTDSIQEDQVYGIWEQVDAADKKEVSQFLQEKAFKKIKRSDLGKDAILIDAIWVRKWKKQEGLRVVKSRLCARGCHDPFKHEMSNRSTTATRLSQRLLVITATNKREPIESWDVAGAFLKGLTYDKLYKRLKELGIKTVERVVAIVVPANVWRHLGEMFEAPLAWQLYLHQCLAEMGAVQSVFDENYWLGNSLNEMTQSSNGQSRALRLTSTTWRQRQIRSGWTPCTHAW